MWAAFVPGGAGDQVDQVAADGGTAGLAVSEAGQRSGGAQQVMGDGGALLAVRLISSKRGVGEDAVVAPGGEQLGLARGGLLVQVERAGDQPPDQCPVGDAPFGDTPRSCGQHRHRRKFSTEVRILWTRCSSRWTSIGDVGDCNRYRLTARKRRLPSPAGPDPLVTLVMSVST